MARLNSLAGRLAAEKVFHALGGYGDGETEVSTAFQNEVDTKSHIIVPKGTYKLTTEVSITKSVVIEMMPGAVIDISEMPAGTTLTEKCAFRVQGSEETSVTVDADISIGDTQITVDSTATFAAGDWVSIRSSELYMDGASGVSENRGHITRVKSIDSSTQLTLVEGSPFAYTASEGVGIRKYNMLEGVKFLGGKIIGGGVGSAHSGIIADYTVGLIVRNMTIDDTESYGVRIAHSHGASVRLCNISDCTSPSHIGNTGYGVALVNGTRNSNITQNKIRNCRHAVSGGGEPLAIHNSVIGNEVVGRDGNYALDCHEPCFWWTFRDNTVTGGSGGILARGQYTTIEGNTVRAVSAYGIRVHSFDTNTDGITGAWIRGNKGFDCGSGFIFLDGDTGQTLKRALVEGNYAQNCNELAVVGQFVHDTLIQGNDFAGHTMVLANVTGELVVKDNRPTTETATGTFTADLYIERTDIDSSDAAVTLTLPDGTFVGQRKILTMSDASNASTVSVTNHETSSPEVFTFNATTDVLVLEWSGSVWWTVKNIGTAT